MTLEKQYKKCLKELISQVETHLVEVDRVMAMKASGDRGELIAMSWNNLNLAKDIAKRYGLGLDFNGKPLKQGGQ